VKAFLVEILNFAWDETVQDPYRIRFTFRCKILRDFTWNGSQDNPPAAGQVAGIPVGGLLGQLPGLGGLLGSVSAQVDGLLAALSTATNPQALQAGLQEITSQIAQIQSQVAAQPTLLSNTAQAALQSLQHGLAQTQTGIQQFDLNSSVLQNGVEQVQGQIATLNESLASTIGISETLIPTPATDVRPATGIEPPTFDLSLSQDVYSPPPTQGFDLSLSTNQ
jgi:hypothetical protein